MIQKESFRACIPELEALFLEQYKENEDGEWGLDPNYETYWALEELGVLQMYTARDDGKLFGYLVVMVNEHIHHKGIIYALSDLIYVAPEYRGQKVAAKLIKHAEDDLREHGVKRLMIAMKIRQQFRSLLSGLGYHAEEEIWEKSL